MYTLMSFLHGHCAWSGIVGNLRKEIDRKEKKIEDLERLEWNVLEGDFINPMNKSGKYTPRRQRIFVLRSFLLETFGLDYMKRGCVLDVAGGKGDLSWLLTNADGIESVVIDPRVTDHSKLVREAVWHAEQSTMEVPEEVIAERGPQGPLEALKLQPPYGDARHLRIFLDHHLLKAFKNDDEDDWAFFWKAANDRAEGLPEMGHHQPRKTGAPDESITDTNSASIACAGRVLDSSIARDLLKSSSLIVGFHPDEATEPCIDLALSQRIPFAVVPCCVFPTLFTSRVLKSGRPVRNYDQFIQFIKEKHPKIRQSVLDFGPGGSSGLIEPRNKVLFMLSSDYDE